MKTQTHLMRHVFFLWLLIAANFTHAQHKVADVINAYKQIKQLDFSINDSSWSDEHKKIVVFKQFFEVRKVSDKTNKFLYNADVLLIVDRFNLFVKSNAVDTFWSYSLNLFFDTFTKIEGWDKEYYLYGPPTKYWSLIYHIPFEEGTLFSKKQEDKNLISLNDSTYTFDLRLLVDRNKVRLFIDNKTLLIREITSISKKPSKYFNIQFEYFYINGEKKKHCPVFPIDTTNLYLKEVAIQLHKEQKERNKTRDSLQQNFDQQKEFQALTLLDFWFIGCNPCFQSFKVMQKLRNDFTEDQLKVELYSFDKQEDIDEYKTKFKLDLNMLFDSQEYIGKFDVKGFPTKILINSQGEVIYRSSGNKPDDYETLKKLIAVELAKAR